MGDEEAKVLEAAKKLPWEERLSHKNWKARVAAYSDVSDIAGKAYDGSNPALKEFGESSQHTRLTSTLSRILFTAKNSSIDIAKMWIVYSSMRIVAID